MFEMYNARSSNGKTIPFTVQVEPVPRDKYPLQNIEDDAFQAMGKIKELMQPLFEGKKIVMDWSRSNYGGIDFITATVNDVNYLWWVKRK